MSCTSDPDRRKAMLILALSGIAVTGAGAAILTRPPQRRETATGCLPDSKRARTVILVDRTDTWSASIATLLAGNIKRIADDLSDEQRLAMLLFDGSAAAPPVIAFDACKPTRSGNALTQTPQHLARAYDDGFAAPLDRALGDATRAGTAKQTELVQALGHLAAHAHVTGLPVTLHLFSDMNEHSSAFAFARKQPPKAFDQHFDAHLGTRLKGITVHVHQLPPPSGSTDPRIEHAWRTALARHAVTFSWETL